MPGWIDSLKARLGRAIGRRERPDVYNDLRSTALAIDPGSIEIPDGESWSGAAMAAMEFGLAGGTATIVAIADGTVSMYVSTGGGVIGAGEHAAVRGAAERFRTVVAESRNLLQVSNELPLPAAGMVRFHLRTVDGAYSAAAPEALLRTSRHPLAPLYAAGQDLLTEIRLSTPGSDRPT
jgi:hypothetical protein